MYVKQMIRIGSARDQRQMPVKIFQEYIPFGRIL